jgi:uncharacterized protein with HEPN domain
MNWQNFSGAISIDDYNQEAAPRRACERLLTIIGEAAKNVNEEVREVIDQPWRDIIRFRDKGGHHYNALSNEVIHAIATISMPEFAQAIRMHLST